MAVTSALPSAPYVLLTRGDASEVQRKVLENPGLVPYEFVLPSSDKSTRSLEIAGSWSNFQDKHRLKKQDDAFCVTLLLPPGKFNFQVYKNGELASQKNNSLRAGASGLMDSLPSLMPDKTTIAIAAILFLLAHFVTHKADWIKMAQSIINMFISTSPRTPVTPLPFLGAAMPALPLPQKSANSVPALASSAPPTPPKRPVIKTATQAPPPPPPPPPRKAAENSKHAAAAQEAPEERGAHSAPPLTTEAIMANALKNFQEENPLAELFGAATSVS